MPRTTYDYANGDKILINGRTYTLREDDEEGYDVPRADAPGLRTVHFELEELYRDYWWCPNTKAWTPR